MNKRAVPVVGLCIALGASVLAWQSALPKTGVTVKDIQAFAISSVNASTDADSVDWMQVTPGFSAAALKAVEAMGPAERVVLVQEVVAIIKATVTTPEFRAAHTAKIKKEHNAVDNGVNPMSYGTTGNMEADTITTTIIPIIMMLRGFPVEAIKQAYEEEKVELAATIKNETGEDRAKAQKQLTRINALAPLMKSNPEEFKKQYTLAKSAYMGGPDTEEKLVAASAGGEQKEKLRQQQIQWEHWKLNAILKKMLTGFIDSAGRVDYKRPTRMEGSRMFYGDGSEMYGLEQLMRGMGQGATNAAVAAARAWLKEVQ